MKIKTYLFLAALTLFSSSIQAARVLPQPFTITLGNGQTVTLYPHGDEHLSWATDGEGFVYSHNGTTWVKTGETQTQFAERVKAEMALQATTRATLGAGSVVPYFPHTGSPRVLVLLVQFQDVKFTLGNPDSAAHAKPEIYVPVSTKQRFTEYLNAEERPTEYGFYESRNYGSVRNYFSTMSDGKFTPRFDVVGPITLSQKMEYYGANSSGGNKDVNWRQMVTEACRMVDDSVNFKDYQSPTDGKYISLVYIIYAGYSESENSSYPNFIWPKSSYFSSTETFDGLRIGRVGINNEMAGRPNLYTTLPKRRMNGIGLFCHEFSHTLGLPDLYTTVSNLNLDNQSPEYWDVMDAGEYTDNGYTPTPYSPWEKELMGWQTHTVIEDPTSHFTIEADKTARINGENANRQHLLLYHLPTTGWWQGMKKLFDYKEGLLVWRINYPSDVVNFSDNPNNTANNPAVAIVPADGVVQNSGLINNSDTQNHRTARDYINSIVGDVFTQEGTNVIDPAANLPNYNWGKDTPISFTLTDIKLENGVVSVNPDTNTAVNAVYRSAELKGQEVYSLTGTRLGIWGETSLKPGIYIVNHQKVVVK